MTVRVKVCCIQDVAEAERAVAAGAWALGLVAEMPSGQGSIDDARIAKITAALSGRVRTFLLTSRTDADAIVEHWRACRTSTLQLVDQVPADDLRGLRATLPDVELVQVIHVRDGQSVAAARVAASLVDALLLDSGDPDKAVKELGGTGRTHDWRLSRAIVESSTVPVLLAGGLRPGNVAAGIAAVRPWGVDLCSGIRDEAGRLQQHRLEAFMAAVRAAAA